MKCRFCEKELKNVFLDLVNSPPSNSLLTREQLNEPEIFYTLKTFVCDNCFLVQNDEYVKPENIFNNNYSYFSSFSTTWLEHCKKYCDMVVEKFKLNKDSFIAEIASNDGHLLKFFKNKGIEVLGIEPSGNVAEVALKNGINTIVDFFNTDFLKKNKIKKADLIIANNVLAHVPNVNDFIIALKYLLKEEGLITIEFPHLLKLIRFNQFDTIYHEHYSYFSLFTVKKMFEDKGLEIFDVQEIGVHGGSLRIFVKKKENKYFKVKKNVKNLLDYEIKNRINDINYYLSFQDKIIDIKNKFLNFLIQEKLKNKKIVAYGAAAKGNTLLNYCGVKEDLIEFVVDASPYKQGKYLPGSHIPVVNESKIRDVNPDYVIILPWNIKDEIMTQLSYIREWGGKFVTAIPGLEVLS